MTQYLFHKCFFAFFFISRRHFQFGIDVEKDICYLLYQFMLGDTEKQEAKAPNKQK